MDAAGRPSGAAESATDPASPGAFLLRWWGRLARLPGGRRLFSRLVGRLAPYTGTMRARVVALEPGFACVELPDRRRIRNHLDSTHAIALANLGELTSGLALTTALPPDVRGIPVRLEIDYLKKARGRLTAESRCDSPEEVRGPTDHEAVAQIRDSEGDTVARLTARWKLDR
ncbi:MAG: hotdog fold domain-containing protein, partial [Gemmatimonadota bacterium]